MNSSAVPAPRAMRELVPDVLRGIAIVAMLVAHALPAWRSKPWAASVALSHVNNLASPLIWPRFLGHLITRDAV